MITEFGKILIFLLLSIVFVAAGLITAGFLRPHKPYPEKTATYECGEEPIGNAWIRLNIRFYVIALVFLLFDVEVVFLFPWALIFRQFALFGFLEMVVFLVILLVGYAYVWVKGDLDWDKPAPVVPTLTRTLIHTAPQQQTPATPAEPVTGA